MLNERMEAALEAGAKAFHESYRAPRQAPWEESGADWKRDIKALVRPAVEAALIASDTFSERSAGHKRVLEGE